MRDKSCPSITWNLNSQKFVSDRSGFHTSGVSFFPNFLKPHLCLVVLSHCCLLMPDFKTACLASCHEGSTGVLVCAGIAVARGFNSDL